MLATKHVAIAEPPFMMPPKRRRLQFKQPPHMLFRSMGRLGKLQTFRLDILQKILGYCLEDSVSTLAGGQGMEREFDSGLDQALIVCKSWMLTTIRVHIGCWRRLYTTFPAGNFANVHDKVVALLAIALDSIDFVRQGGMHFNKVEMKECITPYKQLSDLLKRGGFVLELFDSSLLALRLHDDSVSFQLECQSFDKHYAALVASSVEVFHTRRQNFWKVERRARSMIRMLKDTHNLPQNFLELAQEMCRAFIDMVKNFRSINKVFQGLKSTTRRQMKVRAPVYRKARLLAIKLEREAIKNR